MKRGAPPRTQAGGVAGVAPRTAGARHDPRAADRPRVFDPREPWLLPTLTLLMTRLVLWHWIPYAAEDASITFRFARNFAQGLGLVYNPGERVFGFSSPLWTLWMSAGFALGAPPEVWSRISGMIAEIVALWVFTLLLRRHVSRAAAWCFAYFFVMWPYFAAVTLSGMESTLMLALIALASLGVERRAAWTGPAIGALAMVRPEGLVAAAIVAWWARGRDRIIAASIVVLGVTALGLHFGTPIPQSIVAKSQIYGTPGPWVGRYWWDWLLPFAPGSFTTITEGSHLFLIAVVFAPACVLEARTLWGQRGSGLFVAVAACLAVWVGYASLGVPYFWWYLLVPLAGFALLGATGFPALTRGRALYVSFGLMFAGLWTIVPVLYVGRGEAEFEAFAEVANLLARASHEGETVFLEPIGLIGYGTKLRVRDEIGLVSPSVARRRLAGPGWYADVVASEHPEWLVVRREFLGTGQAFAGAGAPFRSAEERARVLSAYRMLSAAEMRSANRTLVVLRRR